MSIRHFLPNLLACAIIFLGGFLFSDFLLHGFRIFRMALIRRDPFEILAIFVSIVLIVGFLRIINGRISKIRQEPSKWPIQLAEHVSDVFQVYPGSPKGYVRYTDFNAMSMSINDDLMARSPTEQYALLGFSNGFLHGIETRLAELDQTPCNAFRVVNELAWERQFIGWLSRLQKLGTDNAGPSTEILHSVIRLTAANVCENGPITMGFWDKVRNKRTESVEVSGTSSELLTELIGKYQTKFREGGRASSIALPAAIL